MIPVRRRTRLDIVTFLKGRGRNSARSERPLTAELCRKRRGGGGQGGGGEGQCVFVLYTQHISAANNNTTPTHSVCNGPRSRESSTSRPLFTQKLIGLCPALGLRSVSFRQTSL